MRRVAVELVPAGDGALPQRVARLDHLPGIAVGAGPDRQRQAVVALLADHPVGHVPEPVELALLQADARRQPGGPPGRVAQLGPQRIHGDEPLVDQAEDDLGAAAPADRVRVAVLLAGHQQPLALEVLGHLPRQVGAIGVIGAGIAAGLPAEALLEAAELVDRIDHRQVELLRQREVLLAAARGDVHDAGPLLVRHLVPGDDPVLHALRRRQLVERAAVGQPHQLGALRLAHDRRVRSDPRLRAVAQPPAPPVAALHQHVGELRVDGGGHVRGERPRGGGPDQQVLVVVAFAGDRQADGERQVGQLAVALGRQLHVRQPGAAARAPRHDVMAAVDQPAPMALRQEGPDGVVVLVGVGVVAVVPVHPHRPAGWTAR